MEVNSVLVTGANRGLGLEFVKQFLSLPNSPKHVFAGCRNPDKAEALQDLQKIHKNLTVILIDLNDTSKLQETVKVVQGKLGEGQGLNILLNNAAVASGDNLEKVNQESMIDNFRINAVGPLMVSKAFLPLLRSAASHGGSLSVTNAAIINISTGVASITENDTGGGYPYRTSKAALNMITKNLSVDLKKDNILVAAVHPGWLKTDMGGTRATMETDEMAKKLLDLMATFQSEDYTGKLYHFSGRVMPF
ncbi:CSGA-like protein [Mya arenaria]|uniref:CSGA-like protein n=1 Tax=Mya arenaria TaxID=6604 RepID=A0ABY7DXM3_MYAAR|nr:C-factor-like [Mya arenaria]WAR01405.1 CSGA-like protein [Mya arenaria]